MLRGKKYFYLPCFARESEVPKTETKEPSRYLKKKKKKIHQLSYSLDGRKYPQQFYLIFTSIRVVKELQF